MSKLIQTRRLLAMVMAVLLIVSLVPVSAFAEMDNGLSGWKGTTVGYNETDNFYMLQFDGISYGNAEDLVLRATANTNVQMIRAGKTYTVGAPGNDTFVIWGGGESGYIRVSQYHANLANSGLADGEAAPKQGDVFVVSGDFADKNGNVIITLETIYISVGADDALTFSTEKPITNLGTLRDGQGIKSNSESQQFLYFNCDVVQDGWYCFAPESLDCIKFCRNGVIASVGSSNNGGNEWLRYQGDQGWCIELTSWYLNNARDEAAQAGSSVPDSISMPLQAGDVIIVSGNFKQTGNSDNVVHIDETYFIVGENNSLTITAEKPITNLGTLRDGQGIKSNSDSQQYLYFNSDVTQAGWYCFAPESLDCIKFCRNGVIASVGSSNNGGNEWLRYQGDQGWCIELTSWYLNNARDEAVQAGSSVPDSISMPLQAGDVIIVSGNFNQIGNSDNVVHIDETYFVVGENNSLTITTEKPDTSCKHTSTTETTVEPTFTAPGYTAVVCDTCKEELSRTQIAQLSAGVQSWNVTLSDNIRVNFALTLSVPDVSKAKVRVSVADSVSEYAVSGLSCENGAYSLSVDLAAAQMTDELSVSFLYGNSTSTETTYSVRGYADKILTGAYSQATKALVREMLSYGGAAQTYFGYHTDRLASDGITGTAETEIPTSCDPMSVSGSISGVAYYGASLVYRNRIAVRFYFTGDVSGCTFQIGEQTYVPAQKDGLSYIEVSGILPQNLDDAIALTVSSGDSTLSVTYSPMNYIVRMSGKNDDNLKNLLKALYNYHLAAQAYLTAPSTIVVEGGTLAAHEDGAELSENMIFVSLADNLLPGNGDDGVTYTAADGVIKLVRGKETVSLSGSIVKYEDGASYELYVDGDALPMQHNDYLIVEGDFYNAENDYALRISKTYILNTNGTLSFTTTEPVIITVIEAGQMGTHANGWNLPSYDENGEVKEWRGIFFTMAENTVAYNTDWSTKFKPTTEDCIQIIRNGETYDVGNTAAEALIKYSATEYYLETWTITAKPIQNNDILVINGNFTDGTTTFHVSKSMFIMSDEGSMYAISEVPVSIGTMSAHDGTSPKGIYFAMTDNAVPVDSSWNTRYNPISSSTVKRISNGVTTNVGNTGGGTVLKYGENDWWLENMMVGGALQTGETLLVDGYFVNGDTIFRIEASYITVDADGNFVFSNTAPVEVETKLNLTGMQVKETPYQEVDGEYRFHFKGANAGNADTLVLRPTSVNNIQLVRDGVTTGISGKAQDTIAIWGGGGTDGYIKVSQYLADLANSGIADITPKQGDVFIVQGDFKTEDGKTQVTVEKTYIRIGENGSFTMGTVFQQTIDGGHMVASNQGWHGNGIHFELENDYSELPADGWNIEYAPTSTSCVTLIRDGVSHEACYIGRGTIVNCSSTDGDASNDLYLKIEPWTNPAISADAGIQDGDILVVNGDFVNQSNGYVLHIEKTYIKFDMVNETVQFTTYLENTDFGDVTLPTSLNTINYGVWVGSYHVFTDDKLAELKAAGITKLIGIDPYWIGDENKDENGNISMNVLLDRCQKYGITVVAQVRSRTEDGTKYADSWDGTSKPDYADHPALLGFELQDEPMATEFAGLADQKAVLKSLAPDEMVFVNLLPNCAGANSLYGSIITNKNYEDDYIDAFMEQFEPDVLSWDFYATLSGGKIRTQYFSNFEIMAKKNVTKWYTMLSCGHDTSIVSYDTPTEDELRWQMAVALTYGVSDIDHYTYVSHEDSYDCCMVEYDTWERTALYDDIEKVDNEYLSWGNIYKAYNYVGTGCVNVNSNQMLKELSNTVSYTEYGISSISTAEDLLVGIFEYEGNHAYMLTNAGKVPYKLVGTETITMTDTTATITLEDSQWYKCVAVISKGEITYMAIGADGTVEIPVGAYEGVFVIPVLN